MQDNTAAYVSIYFKPKKWQLDTWTDVGFTAKFKPH
jgi:hypothetical protein